MRTHASKHISNTCTYARTHTTHPWSHRSAPETEYDPDTQYTSVTLWCHITSLLWRQKGVAFVERRALLLILNHYVELSQACTMHAHICEGPLAELIKKLKRGKFSKKQTRDSYIGECTHAPTRTHTLTHTLSHTHRGCCAE